MKVENGTFYHCGETLNARITYRLTAKMYEKSGNYDPETSETGLKVYRADIYVKVCNHFTQMTLQKILYDESSNSSFLCFGGGNTNLEVEYIRDTFCISA
jgi:hypothetical protein